MAGAALLIPLILFWVILHLEIPYTFSRYFSSYSLGVFLIVFCLYYFSFRLPDQWGVLACFGLTLILFALTLSFKWTSGYSDNKIIAGILPYKDGAGYYLGASLILNGLPLGDVVQSGWRPLFPGFMSSLFFLLGGNLKTVLAVLVLITGIGTYISSRQILKSFGAVSASLYITFLYFYIQPMVGLTMTELLGYTMGCFAFCLLWRTSDKPRWLDFVLGLAVLVVALSVRAGTFFMLPLLAVWGGWAFRGSKRFSVRLSALAMTVIMLSYLLANTVYARLIGVPEGKLFGNFAYSLYGQVHGGTGWHSAIEELGTRDPSVIYDMAFQFFLQHPFSLVIGVVKSYRDFFLPGENGIFVFGLSNQFGWPNYIAWGSAVALLIMGLIRLVKKWDLKTTLLMAGFVGFLFSIPFLPPVDGGSRFYASTAPFFFSIPTFAVGKFLMDNDQSMVQNDSAERSFLRIGAIVLSALAVFVPLVITNISSVPVFTNPECSASWRPFVINPHPEFYVDLVFDKSRCGLMSEICFEDFDRNGVEKSVDDFYQEVYSMTVETNTDVRIIPAVDLIEKKFHYFYVPAERLQMDSSPSLISGCATEIRTKNQSIYRIESILSDGN